MSRIGIFILILTLISGCSIFREQERSSKRTVQLTGEEEYLYAFTEATKQKLFGNIDRAENLYKQCLKVQPQSSAVYYQLSKISVLKGDADYSETYAAKAYELNRDNYWYALNKAQVFELTGKIDSAIVVYNQIFKQYKDKINIGYRLGRLLEEKERYSDAMDVYNEIENRMGGADKQLILSKIIVYVELDQHEKAINELEEGLKIYPEDKDFLTYMAKIYSAEGKEKMADDIYKSLLELDSEDIESLFSYILHLIKFGKTDEALDITQRIINEEQYSNNMKINLLIELFNTTDIFTGNEELMLNIVSGLNNDDIKSKALLVDCYIRMDSLVKAGNILEDIAFNEKRNYVVWEQLINIKNELGEYEEVIQYADSALKYFNNQPGFYLYKGFAQKSLNNLQGAAKTFEEGIRSTEQVELNLTFYGMLGDIYYDLNEYEKSDSAFDYVLKHDSSRTIVLNNYSYYLSLREEKLDKAVKMMKRCLALDSTKYSYYDTYGWVLYKKGEYDKAEKYIRKAIEMGGNTSCEVVEHYGDVLQKLGENEKALKYYEDALECSDNDTNILEKIKNLKTHNELE